MGDYNAEKRPYMPDATVVLRNYGFVTFQRILTDEWNVSSAHRVSSFADGTNRIRFKVKYDPHAIAEP